MEGDGRGRDNDGNRVDGFPKSLPPRGEGFGYQPVILSEGAAKPCRSRRILFLMLAGKEDPSLRSG